MEMFSMRERRKFKHKSGGTKPFKAEDVRKYFVNSKFGDEVFRWRANYIICSFDFRNIS